MGLSDGTVKVMKDCVPALEKSGVEISGKMYTNMMAAHPEMQFDMSRLKHVTDKSTNYSDSVQASKKKKK